MQRTTAGTRAAVAARQAEQLYCASFVCASATARALRWSAPEAVSFVIAGGLSADEDLACAELIATMAAGRHVDAERYVRRASHSAAASDLREGVRRGFAGVTIDDVGMCLEIDRFDFAMRATDHGTYLRLARESPPAVFASGTRRQ